MVARGKRNEPDWWVISGLEVPRQTGDGYLYSQTRYCVRLGENGQENNEHTYYCCYLQGCSWLSIVGNTKFYMAMDGRFLRVVLKFCPVLEPTNRNVLESSSLTRHKFFD